MPLIRLHDMRHTYATIELAHGTHPRIVSERLGHASTAITLGLYTHVSVETQKAAAETMARRLLEAGECDNITRSAGDVGTNRRTKWRTNRRKSRF